jgi:PAS domain S-box-containing protein
MVGVVLTMEFVFLGGFWFLLQQTETEASRAERSKEILGNMQRLLRLLYDGGSAIEQYTITKSADDKKRFLGDINEVQKIMKMLETAVKGDRRTTDLVLKMESDFNRVNELVSDVVRVLEGSSSGLSSAQELVEQRKKELHEIEVKLIPNLAQLNKIEKDIEAESPAAERRARDRIKTLLAAAVPINIILALALAVFFTRSITARLEILVDNTDLMTRRRRLHPPLPGNDEISRLDRVFHEMAEELRTEEERLRASEERIRKIIEFMPIGLVILDKACCIEFINKRTQEMFGYEQEELLGESLEHLFAAAPENASEGLQKIFSKSLNHITDVMAVSKSKKEFPAELTISDFPGAERDRYLAIVLDVTERVEIQRMRQAFVAMVSHELRSPLTSIKGYLSLIDIGAFGPLSPEVVDGAQRSERNVVRLITLINDLLDLQKMEEGMLSISPQVTNVGTILTQSLDAVRVLAQERGVRIEMPSADWELKVDAGRIIQVMVNLLSNAIKFSPANERITVQVGKDIHNARFRVIDRGRGIPPRFKEAIFERFQQVSDSDSTKLGGTGLGLAICKAIVERHGGSIGVESEEGRGSAFWFQVPLS